ncbi:MAG: response regulator [Gemmatimonadaceae bacterium]|nr:response regulator [Chitinophagaceae bacterium]
MLSQPIPVVKIENQAEVPSLWKKLLWWFNVAIYQDGQRYINRFKLLQVTIFSVFLLCTILNYFSGLPYSLLVTAGGCLSMLVMGYFVKRHRLREAFFCFFLFTNIIVFWLNYVEGTSSGAFFFYFILIIMANFISVKERPHELLVVYLATFTTLVLTFFICPKDSGLQSIENDMKDINLYVNASISFLVGGLFSYSMMKDNFLHEKVLVSKQKFLDSVYNTSLDAIFIIDCKKGIITDCNIQSIKLFEVYSKSEIIGKPVSNFFSNSAGENEREIVRLLEDSEISWQGEVSCIAGVGNVFTGYVSAVPLAHEVQSLKKINILDITDIKQARAEVEMARDKAEQAVLTKTKFLSNMSHELRTPLNGIIGTTNLLLQDEYLPTQNEYLNVLKYSSEQMLNVINDILDFSKIEVGKMDLEKTTFNLRSLVDNVHNLFKNQFEEKNVGLEIVFDEKLEQNYVGDQTRLGQVLSNLISNACKFTSKGKVVVSVTHIAQNSNACTIRFSVQDSGIGIPEEKQQLVFDSFTQVDTATTRKFGGTGLGLSISSKIVELFGGKLRLESSAENGSLFYFVIQLGIIHQQNPFVNEAAVKQLRSLTGLRILLAEDNPINMLVAKTVLSKWGIEITEAVNGREALDRYDESSYDVLLIDLEMPEMDGFELLDKVRKNNANIPVIAFTAAVYDNMQAHLINKGFSDYVQKPFRPEELHAKLARYAS